MQKKGVQKKNVLTNDVQTIVVGIQIKFCALLVVFYVIFANIFMYVNENVVFMSKYLKNLHTNTLFMSHKNQK